MLVLITGTRVCSMPILQNARWSGREVPLILKACTPDVPWLKQLLMRPLCCKKVSNLCCPAVQRPWAIGAGWFGKGLVFTSTGYVLTQQFISQCIWSHYSQFLSIYPFFYRNWNVIIPEQKWIFPGPSVYLIILWNLIRGDVEDIRNLIKRALPWSYIESYKTHRYQQLHASL